MRGSLVVTGRATLYVSGLVQPWIIMVRREATLDLYVGGPSASIGGLVNEGRAAAFAYYGLPANTNLSVGGNGAFVGTIYAPAANVYFGGGGNDELDLIGAVVGRNIIMRGRVRVHYDESLSVAGPAL